MTEDKKPLAGIPPELLDGQDSRPDFSKNADLIRPEDMPEWARKPKTETKEGEA